MILVLTSEVFSTSYCKYCLKSRLYKYCFKYWMCESTCI